MQNWQRHDYDRDEADESSSIRPTQDIYIMHCTFTFWFTLCRRGQSGICLTTGRITMETGRAQDTLKNEQHNIQEPVNQSTFW